MTDEIQLTPTSHIVLGLLSMSGQATPYDLKQMAALTEKAEPVSKQSLFFRFYERA